MYREPSTEDGLMDTPPEADSHVTPVQQQQLFGKTDTFCSKPFWHPQAWQYFVFLHKR